MKKNLLKRIGAVALAVAVSLTMGTAAFAADDIPASGVKEMSTPSASATFNIKKEIVFFNAESSTVYEPAVEYTYTVSVPTQAQVNNAQIKDKDGHVAGVKAGVAGGVSLTTGKATFSKDTAVSNVTSAGTSVKKDIEVKVTASAFTQPGVYRYIITEGNLADAKGVVEATETGHKTRYLDVYIMRGESGMQVYGYVLYKGAVSDTLDAKSKDPASPDLDAKTEGFVNDDDTTADFTDVDTYTTYNLEVEKTISGTMGDKGHKFPFEVELTGSVAGANYTIGTTKTAVANDGKATTTATLADTETVKMIGVPEATPNTLKGTVKDTNDTQDVYTASIGSTTGFSGQTLKFDNGETTKDIANNVTASVAFNLNNAASQGKELSHLTIDNKLDQISPTNVVMRFAPYLFILGAAIVLLVLMRRRRASQDAE